MFDGNPTTPDTVPTKTSCSNDELVQMNNSLVRDIYVSTYFDVLRSVLDRGTNEEVAVKSALKMAKLAAGEARVATATLYG